LRFGIVLPRYDTGFNKVASLAREAEELKFHSLWVTDHLQPRRGKWVLESWTVLSAVAGLTGRIRLGTVVLCYTYRHPSLLAKMAATLDHISGGRLELGIGSGSPPQEEEHKALGIPYPGRWERINQLREYVDVVKILLSCSGRVSYSGAYYKIQGAECNTPTVQKPHPPIWVGARRRRTIEVAVEKGDGWNFYGESLEEYKKASEYAQRVCDQIGKHYGDLRKSIFTTLLLYRTDDEKRKLLRKLGIESEETFYRQNFTILHGNVEEFLRKLDVLEQLGVELVILRDMLRDGEGIRVFASEVLPSYAGGSQSF